MIKDQLLVYEDLAILKNKCPSCCKPAGHLIPKCSLLSYNPDPSNVIKKYLNRNNQKREIFTRNNIRLKINSLAKKWKVIESQKIFIDQNASKFLSPKNKARRPNVYDVQSFLNTGGNWKHSNSIPVTEENQEQDDSLDESEIEESEVSPKVIFFFLKKKFS